jgi:hypothetical protein
VVKEEYAIAELKSDLKLQEITLITKANKALQMDLEATV